MLTVLGRDVRDGAHWAVRSLDVEVLEPAVVRGARRLQRVVEEEHVTHGTFSSSEQFVRRTYTVTTHARIFFGALFRNGREVARGNGVTLLPALWAELTGDLPAASWSVARWLVVRDGQKPPRTGRRRRP